MHLRRGTIFFVSMQKELLRQKEKRLIRKLVGVITFIEKMDMNVHWDCFVHG